MKLRRLELKNFRKHILLTWNDIPDVACIIGSGDSGKTSVLESIHMLLQPYYKQPFEEIDFHNRDLSKSIEITGCFELSDDSFLIDESRYGHYLCGWHDLTGLNPDGPTEHEAKCLRITLSCDDSLEPQWVISNTSGSKEFSLKDRKTLSSLYLDTSVNQRTFTWASGTALRNNLPETVDVKDVVLDIVNEAQKGAQNSSKINDIDMPKALKAELVSLGVSSTSDIYNAGLDINAINANVNEICLHKNNLPFRKMGQGTQRLFGIASQLLNTGLAPVLVDEIELGLDPNRIRRLMRSLESKNDQLIFTTHSPIVMRELSVESLCKIINDKIISFKSMKRVDEAQGRMRSYAESLLSNKLIVCEGKTEVGICRGIDEELLSSENTSFAEFNISFVDAGGGSKVEAVSHDLLDMGYNVCAFLDSDVATDTVDDKKGEINVVRWETGLCLESAICKYLTDGDLSLLLTEFVEKNELHNDDSFKSKFSNSKGAGFDYSEIQSRSTPYTPDFKSSVGKGLSNAEVFKKSLNKSEKLGRYIYRKTRSYSTENHLRIILDSLVAWVKS